ncbi:MAG: class I SAM-dependent methyltransferase [Rhodospirillales bacterium]|nr:class I SAM-dependent methyltransferase [Rhodospirillales bacterium]
MHSHRSRVPSPWIVRHAGLIADGSHVLDLACGGGRHTRHLRERGLRVTAIDIDTSGLADLADDPQIEIVEMDLERPGADPLAGRRFDAVVVTDYLFRPLLVPLVDCLKPGGIFLYETFAMGNERFGRPRNPDFLLRRGELLALAKGRLSIVAYEHRTVPLPNPKIVQHLCAGKPLKPD